MNKYKPEILFFTIFSIILILFPPVRRGVHDEGYSFLITLESPYYINYYKLLVELVLIGLVTILFFYSKYSIMSLVNKIGTNRNSALYLLKTFLLAILFFSSIILLHNFFKDIVSLTKPVSLLTIPQKYPRELARFNERIRWHSQTYYYSDYNIFKRILNEDKYALMNLYLPDSLIPDITPYLDDYIPKRKPKQHKQSKLINFRWDLLLFYEDLSLEEIDRDRIFIPFDKTITEGNSKRYFDTYKSLKNEYLNTIKADAKIYVDDYHNYSWRNSLQTPLTILLSLISISILYIRFRKHKKK